MTLPNPHQVILASAGSGKTFALTTRFLELVAAGESPRNILAVTFTRKAAGEILRKLVSRLAVGAATAEGAAKLSKELGIPPRRPQEFAQALATVARLLDRLQIGTIDSFFSSLASACSFRLGLPGAMRIIDEDEDTALRSEAVSISLRDGDRSELLELIDARGAGAADRSVHEELLDAVSNAYSVFLQSDASAWGALPTGTPLETDDLAVALQRLEKVPLAKTKSGDDNQSWRKAHDKSVAAAKAGRWDDFLDAGIGKAVLCCEATFSRAEISSPVATAYGLVIEHAKAVILTRLCDHTRATRRLIHRFDAALRALKAQRSVCSFDDIPATLIAANATSDHDSVAEMYFVLDASARHLLLDEFQDTSLDQWRLLEPLVDEIVSHSDSERTFLCVGDVKQSLYGWRNAQPTLLPAIPARWSQVQERSLTKSYRSSPVVIDAVNFVMGTTLVNAALAMGKAHPADVVAAQRWASIFKDHDTNLSTPGYVRLSVTEDADDTAGLKAVAVASAAARIAELHREAPGRTIAVLFRTRAMIGLMKQELSRLGVATSEEGGNPLTDSDAVSFALSALTLADHPSNTAARFHVAVSPLSELLGVRFSATGEAIATAATEIRARLSAYGFAATLQGWSDRLRSLGDDESRRFDQLIDLAEEFDDRARHDGAPRASEFVRFASQRRVEDPSTANVRLMTMHAAKGLEFDTVVLPWLDDRLAARPPAMLVERPGGAPDAAPSLVMATPSKSQRALDPRLSTMYNEWRSCNVLEDLCVLYVALTRAACALEIFIPPAPKAIADDASESLTFARILRGAINPDPANPGQVLYASGDRAWYKRPGLPPPKAIPARRPAPSAPALDAAPKSSTRFLPRVSPSQSHAEDVALEAPTSILAPEHARARGILAHAWLEHVAWIEDPVPASDELDRIASAISDLPSIDVSAERSWFLDRLEHPAIKRALSREVAQSASPSAAIQVYRELPFALIDPERAPAAAPSMLTGRIDRLVVARDPSTSRVLQATVIDFKTDTLIDRSSTALELHAKRYRDQFAAYQRATARLLGCDPSIVRTELVFLAHGVTIALAG